MFTELIAETRGLTLTLLTFHRCIVYPAILGVIGYWYVQDSDDTGKVCASTLTSCIFVCSMLSAFVQPFGILWIGFLLIHAGLGSTNSVRKPITKRVN